MWLSAVEPTGTFLVDVLPASLVAATGMSLAYIPALMAAMAGAPPEQAGLASGIVNTTYQVGSALGQAALTALAASQGAARPGDLPALTADFSSAFLGAAAIAAAGALAIALLMKGKKSSAAAAAQEVAAESERVGS
ncbi:hypothetical protein SUDANB105_07689 [Streptomyces sp. enrichment culture]